MSHPTKSLKMRWCGYVTFPDGAVAGDELPIEVKDGEKNPVKAGTLELFGASIAIVDGKGSLKYEDFIKGKHETGIWLYRRGFLPIPGGLTFA